MDTLDLPIPQSDERNLPYWEAARHDEFVIPRCRECGAVEAPPVVNCRSCLADDFEWSPDAGTGTVYSFIEYHRAWTDAWRGHTPYIVAIVELDAGPRILSSLLTAPDGRTPGVGDRVAVAFQERGEGWKVPVFGFSG